MSLSISSPFKVIVLVLGAGSVIAIAWVGLVQILRVDAFARFQGGSGPIGQEIGVQMTNVHMKAYENGVLSAVADMEELTVLRDRSQLTMFGVSNGEFIDRDGDVYHFEGDKAIYQYTAKTFRAEEGTHIWNDEMDLTAAAFTFNERTKTILVSGGVEGMLHDGDVKARDISVNTETKKLTAHNVTWTGTIQDPLEEDKRKPWKFDAETMQDQDDIRIWVNGTATDGEVFIMADLIEHNRVTDIVIATGNVKYWSLDVNMKCEKATIFRDERRALLEKNVIMFIKAEDDEELRRDEIPNLTRADRTKLETNPQGATQEEIDVLRSDENLRDYPSKVIADQVEYWYRDGERRAIITGNPFARQDLTEGWRLGWAHSAFYDGEAKKLTLKSKTEAKDVRDVYFFLSIGDIFKANEVTFSTDDEVKEWSGKWANATVYIDEDDGDGGG